MLSTLTPVLSNNSPHCTTKSSKYRFRAAPQILHICPSHSSARLVRWTRGTLSAWAVSSRSSIQDAFNSSRSSTACCVYPERLCTQRSLAARAPTSRTSRRGALDVQLEDWQIQDDDKIVQRECLPLEPATSRWSSCTSGVTSAIAITVSLWYRSGLSAAAVTIKTELCWANQNFSKHKGGYKQL